MWGGLNPKEWYEKYSILIPKDDYLTGNNVTHHLAEYPIFVLDGMVSELSKK